MKTKILLILSTATLSACANLNSTFVNPPVEAPIVRGQKSSWNLTLGSHAAHEYEFSSDASLRPPTLDQPAVRSQSSPFVGGAYNFSENFSFGIELHPFNFGVDGKAKYQLLGDKQSGFQLASFGRAGVVQTTKSGDQNGEFGPGGHKWEAKSSGYIGSLGLSAGYFLNESIMLYLGGSFGALSTKAEIDHKANTSGTSPAASYSADDKANLTSLGGGIVFGRQTLLTLGLTYTQVNYDKAPTRYDNQISLMVGF